jgi:type I restriction enzyme S subunit
MKSVASNLANLKPNLEWASLPLFDRKGWKRVRFGDVVKQMKEQVDPEADGIERYVAGEHMETENVHIRKWGTVGDGYLGPAFIRGFRKGQVLYGSRRTYLKKVAVAEWDGVTANTTFVLETVEGRMLQELLPWLMLSERFTKHSVQESKGSTNPYINYPDIAKFEFDLPPLDQQRRIAEILWAVDEFLQQWQATDAAVTLQRRAFITEFMGDHAERFERLGDFLDEVQYGSSSKCIIQKNDGLYPVLRIPNVIGERIDFTDLVWSEPAPDAEKYQLEHGDVLIVRTNGNPDYVGRTAVFEGSVYEQCLFASYLIRLRPSPVKLLSQFLHEMLASDKVKRDIRKQVKSSAGNYNLNTEGIRGLNIPVPSLKVQRELLGELDRLSDGLTTTRHHMSAGANLNTSLLNTLFGTATL